MVCVILSVSVSREAISSNYSKEAITKHLSDLYIIKDGSETKLPDNVAIAKWQGPIHFEIQSTIKNLFEVSGQKTNRIQGTIED